MPVPKVRTSRSKRNMRRSHHALSAPASSICTNCGSVKLPHSVCEACGFHNGKQVLVPKRVVADDFAADLDAEV